jgi:hypothetical protein
MTDLDDAIARLVEMQEDVISGSDAVPFAFYAQESTRYWTNDVTDFRVEVESEELQRITYTVTMTCHGAEATEGYEGQPEESVQTLIPTVLQYFSKRRQLKRTNADSAVTNLDPRGAQITGGRVNRGLTDSVGQRVFGIDFNLELPMFQDTEQSVF